jgi:hypothetical protein
MNFGYAAMLIQLHVLHVKILFAAAELVFTYGHHDLLDFILPFHSSTCVRDTVLLILVQCLLS